MKSLRIQSSDGKGLSSWVTTSLREAILNGAFEPGEKLDQDMLAGELEVSRTPIREALKVLASEGFVEIRSFRGAYIPTVHEQEIFDVYEIRWILESEITLQATPRMPENILDQLEMLLKGYETAVASIDERHLISVDQDFHGTIADYCQNKLFKELLDKLNNRIIRVRSFAMHQPGSNLDESHDEHKAILAAIRTRKAQEASALMEKHLKNSAHRIMKYISDKKNTS